MEQERLEVGSFAPALNGFQHRRKDILDRVAAIEENTEDGRAAKNTANASGQAGACQRNQT
jgi:hypothetical protein